MIYFTVFKALIYSAVFSLTTTPIDFLLANALGAIDIPNDTRRMHSKPIPRLGGISLFASFIAVTLLFGNYSSSSELIYVFIGTIFIVILGIVDDCKSLAAKIKLTVQTIATVFAVSIFNNIGLGLAFFLFGTLWILTLTNAHNFIDGLDGLCIGISLTEALTLGLLFLLKGQSFRAIECFIISGACIGFMPYNETNAKIFMGDTGSTFLGFILGFFSLKLIVIDPSLSTAIAVCFVFAMPISDMIFTVTRRILRQQSVFTPDRSHIHHILADGPLGHRNASLLLRALAIAFAVIGITIAQI